MLLLVARAWFIWGGALAFAGVVVKEWSSSPQNVHSKLIKEEATSIYRLEVVFKDRLCDRGDVNSHKDNSTFLVSRKYGNAVRSRVVGPDELLLHIEGYSLQNLLPVYKECGYYEKAFSVHVDGVYHLHLVRLRTNYSSINELMDVFPEINYEVIVSDWIALSKHPSHQIMNCNRHIGVWALNSSSAQYMDKSFDTLESAEALVPITLKTGDKNFQRDLPLQSFVNVSSKTVMSADRTGCGTSIDAYSFFYCNHTAYTADYASALLAKRTLTFIGDSQSRVLVSTLLEWACSIPIVDKNKQFKNTYIAETAEKCPGLKVNVVSNVYCEIRADFQTKVQKDELVFFNCGHWPASQEHFTFDMYGDALEALIQKIKRISPNRFVFIETLPMPVRNDKFVKSFRDWRTLHRLYVYNRIAEKLFKQHNFSFLPTFETLLPLVDKFCDNAHYTAAGALQPIIQQVLIKVENLLGK